LKLTVSGFFDAGVLPFHIPEPLFWSGMVLIMILSFLIRPRRSMEETREASEELDRLGTTEDSGEDEKSPNLPEPGDGGPAGSPEASVN
jgi:hypothetical protein